MVVSVSLTSGLGQPTPAISHPFLEKEERLSWKRSKPVAKWHALSRDEVSKRCAGPVRG